MPSDTLRKASLTMFTQHTDLCISKRVGGTIAQKMAMDTELHVFVRKIMFDRQEKRTWLEQENVLKLNMQ